MTDVTQILSQIEHGNLAASEQLLPLVYDELRRLAAQKLAHEKPGQTLGATAATELRNLGTDPSGVTQSQAFDVNDAGRIAGCTE